MLTFFRHDENSNELDPQSIIHRTSVVLCEKKCCKRHSITRERKKLITHGRKVAERVTALFNRSTLGSNEFSSIRKSYDDTSMQLANKIGYRVQAHHLISVSFFKDTKIAKLAKACAYDVNNGYNCIFLPNNFGYQKWDNLQRHYGNHYKPYYSVINCRARKKLKGYEEKDFCNLKKMKELHKKFHEIEEDLFNFISMDGIQLYYYSFAACLTFDYRSELQNSASGFFSWTENGFVRKEDSFYSSKNPKFPVP